MLSLGLMSGATGEGEPSTDLESELPARRRFDPRRWLVGSFALVVGLALFFGGAFDDPEHTVQMVRDAGPWGVIVYLAAFAFLQPFGISGHAFTLAAAVVWGGLAGFAIAMVGALGAATVGFVFARYVAYEWVQDRIPARVRRLERWLVDRGLLGVIVFRTFTFTAPPALFLVGTLRIRLWTMLAGTAIGFVPGVAVDIFLGGQLWSWLVA